MSKKKSSEDLEEEELENEEELDEEDTDEEEEEEEEEEEYEEDDDGEEGGEEDDNDEEDFSGNPTIESARNFVLLSPMIYALITEVKELSRKKPDGHLNKLKVTMINKRLTPMKELLSILPVAEYLDLLSEETLPTNSDAVLILGQFAGAMESFKSKFHGWDSIMKNRRGWWTTEGHVPDDEL